MIDLVLDFETYFDQEFSLQKLTTQEYICSPMFEVIGVAAIVDKEPMFIEQPHVEAFLKVFDWSNINLIGHNLIFDAGVLKHHYGHSPKLHSCTLSYSRAIIGARVPSCSLATVAAFFGMRKDTQALMNMRGLRYQDCIDPSRAVEWDRYKRYGNSDVVQAKTIYDKLLPHIPAQERVVVDIIIRMFTEGNLSLHEKILYDVVAEANAEADAKLAAAGITDRKQLRSREKFAALLQDCGVTPPLKISERTGQSTYAFSKDDLEFIELLTHPDKRVSTLVEAKLNASSTIQETRATRLLNIAHVSKGRLQVPLSFSGAHTHRFSGVDSLNLQNLPRSDKSLIRHAIRAPKGYKLVVRDSSQIEARILAFIAEQWDLVKQFANGEDVYALFASDIYQRAINKKDDPDERFIGKTGILGLGYGSGDETFMRMVLTSERPLPITDEFAREVVQKYRQKYAKIVQFWRRGDRMLPAIYDGSSQRFGPAITGSEKLTLPSGLDLTYPQLSKHVIGTEHGFISKWQYYKPRYKSFANLYGAKLTENLVQALARIQITDTMVKMRVTNPSWHCALQVHDELLYLAPNSEAESCQEYLTSFMNAQPSWAKTYPYAIPLASEGGIGDVYAECK